MYRCNSCGEVFDHSETVTESRPLGEESYQVCPICGSTGEFTEIIKKKSDFLYFLGYKGNIYWGISVLIPEENIIALLGGVPVIMDKLDETMYQYKSSDYLTRFPEESKVHIVGAARYFEEE